MKPVFPATLRAWLLAPALLAGGLSSQHMLYTVHGDAADHLFGANVRDAGDVDGDGYADFIGGAPNPTGIGVAKVYSGRDGRLLHRFVGDQVGDYFGVSVAGTGDLNNDGYGDLIVGAWFFDVARAGSEEGLARVFSGKDGTVLYNVTGVDTDRLGTSVSGAGDVNADGHQDFIIGAPLANDGTKLNSGTAWVYSGKDGTLIHRLPGESAGDQFGIYVNGPGDVNKDGHDDVLVGAHLDNFQGRNNCGSARLISGKDGTTIFTVYGDAANDEFGRSVGGAGDVNKDGWLDFIVGAPFADPNGPQSGMARVYSGKDGSTLHTFNGQNADDWFGWTVSGNGDVNGDGHSDLLLSAFLADPNGVSAAGTVTCYSGKDFSVLLHFEGENVDDWYGQNVHMGGDVNRDGCADILVGAEATDVGGANTGSLIVLSGKQLTLSTDLHEFDPTQAGTQKFTVNVGSALGGLEYWVVGSFTGTLPGTVLGGINVPLLPDSYTRIVMTSSNGSIYQQFRGTLDAQGKANAMFNIPAGLPPVPNISLYHAAIIFEANGTLRAATNPTVLRIQN